MVAAAVPCIEVVHATAIIKDCPSSVVTEDEIDSLVRFLTSKDHLSRNIENVCTTFCHRGNLEMKDLRIWYKSSKMPIFWKVLGGTYIEALGIRLMTRET